MFGVPGSFPGVIDLASLDGNNGFAIPGIASGGLLGGAVGRAGDVNGDGISDIIVGAPFAENTSGVSYVIFGHIGSFPASFDLTTLDGTNGFSITGANGEDQSGNAVACAGDVNGDGVDDILIGAPGADCQAGMSYVVFGIAGAQEAPTDT